MDKCNVEKQQLFYMRVVHHYMVSSLHSSKPLIVAFFLLMLLLGTSANFVLASGSNSGFVQYEISVSGQESSQIPFSLPVSATINESVQPTDQSGFIDLTLSLSSDVSNFSYSRVVNASSLPVVFPYLSGLSNQSLSYQVQGYSIAASLFNTGQVPITFNGTSYQATKYLVAFEAVNASSATSFSGNGTVISMPSGLIEEVQFSLNQTVSVSVLLLSTDLSLNAQGISINPLGASLLGVASVAAVAIAGPTIFRRAKKSKTKQQSRVNEVKSVQEGDIEREEESKTKPSYWVE